MPRRYRLFGPSRRRRNWYEPEQLGPEQDARDAQDPGRRFYVYVLATDYGHYVGHSARPRARFREHLTDPGSPVADGNPQLIWISRPLNTRNEAAGFEAAMKSLRQRRAKRFAEIVGAEPQPFRARRKAPVARKSTHVTSYRDRDGCGPLIPALMSVTASLIQFASLLTASFIRRSLSSVLRRAAPLIARSRNQCDSGRHVVT